MGSVCTSYCPGEEVHQVKCEESGKWSEPLKRCITAGQCSKPEAPPGVLFVCGDYFPGETCKTRCKASTDDVVELGNEGNWRVTIKCTRKLDWDPDPAKLRCVRGCRRREMGDGWCDPQNNNAHCRWDGGDCCQSTTSHRVVRHMPLCESGECACKDPDAMENSRGSGIDDEDDDDDDGNKSEGSGSAGDRHFRTST